MKHYEIIDHTADVGIRAFGKDLSELFRNAAVGMFELMADLDSVHPTQSQALSLAAEGVEDLYILWHQELLYRSSVDRCLYKEFSFEAISEKNLKSVIRGEPFHPKTQTLKKEVKAATYHGLKVARTKDGWMGEVIFDI